MRTKEEIKQNNVEKTDKLNLLEERDITEDNGSIILVFLSDILTLIIFSSIFYLAIMLIVRVITESML